MHNSLEAKLWETWFGSVVHWGGHSDQFHANMGHHVRYTPPPPTPTTRSSSRLHTVKGRLLTEGHFNDVCHCRWFCLSREQAQARDTVCPTEQRTWSSWEWEGVKRVDGSEIAVTSWAVITEVRGVVWLWTRLRWPQYEASLDTLMDNILWMCEQKIILQ